MAINPALFATGDNEHETPDDLFAALDAEFHFVMDVAASRANAKCMNYFGPDHWGAGYRDGLTADWLPVSGFGACACWCNPPYARPLQGQFIAKAAAERLRGVLTVMLLPARTDTKMFHTHIYDVTTWQAREGIELRLLKGRLKFKGTASSAPFPSMVIVFRPKRGRSVWEESEPVYDVVRVDDRAGPGRRRYRAGQPRDPREPVSSASVPAPVPGR